MSHPSSLKLALKLLVQPSSLVVKGIGSTYSSAQDLGYVHTNLRLLSRKSEEYKRVLRCGAFVESFDGVGTLEVASIGVHGLGKLGKPDQTDPN